MIEPVKSEQASQIPFVTVSEVNGHIQIETNIKPELKPLVLWLLEQAKLTILTKAPQDQSRIKSSNGSFDFLKRIK